MSRSAGLRFNGTLNFELPFKSKTIKHWAEQEHHAHVQLKGLTKSATSATRKTRQ